MIVKYWNSDKNKLMGWREPKLCKRPFNYFSDKIPTSCPTCWIFRNIPLSPPPPKKKYNRTFSINSFQNFWLIWICFRIMKLYNYLSVSRQKSHSIWLNIQEEIWIFACKVRHKSFPSNYWQKGDSLRTMISEFHIWKGDYNCLFIAIIVMQCFIYHCNYHHFCCCYC